MMSFRRKLARELKWLVVSVMLVASVIGSLYGIASLSQWNVNRNMARLEAGEIELVQHTRWFR